MSAVLPALAQARLVSIDRRLEIGDIHSVDLRRVSDRWQLRYSRDPYIPAHLVDRRRYEDRKAIARGDVKVWKTGTKDRTDDQLYKLLGHLYEHGVRRLRYTCVGSHDTNARVKIRHIELFLVQHEDARFPTGIRWLR